MIRIENLSIDLGEFHLRDIDLRIEEGEYMVLLGPTGAGKTVLVECLVGIYRPNTGRMLIDGEDVTRLYPEERNVGYVPQDYALFPHLNVRDNIGFGMALRGRPPREIARKVEELPLETRENDPNVDAAKTYATVVYRFINGQAIVTPVKIGASDATHTEIVSGLGEDDLVIVGPYKALEGMSHEQKVKDEREVEKDKADAEPPESAD